MAIATQLRLPQITGSFGISSKDITDQLDELATGSIDARNMQDIMSHMASAIKRIHGADSFTEQIPGQFESEQFISLQPALGAVLFGQGTNESDQAGSIRMSPTSFYLTASNNKNLVLGSDSQGIYFNFNNESHGAMTGNANGFALMSTNQDDLTLFGMNDLNLASIHGTISLNSGSNPDEFGRFLMEDNYLKLQANTGKNLNLDTSGGYLTISKDEEMFGNLITAGSSLLLSASNSKQLWLDSSAGLIGVGKDMMGSGDSYGYFTGASNTFIMKSVVGSGKSITIDADSGIVQLSKAGYTRGLMYADDVEGYAIASAGNEMNMSVISQKDINLTSPGGQVFFNSGSEEYGKMYMDNNSLVMSSSAGKGLAMQSDSQIYLNSSNAIYLASKDGNAYSGFGSLMGDHINNKFIISSTSQTKGIRIHSMTGEIELTKYVNTPAQNYQESFGHINMGSSQDGLLIETFDGKDIGFVADSGVVNVIGANATGSFVMDNANDMKLGINENIILTLNDGFSSTMSGSLLMDGGENAGEIRLKEVDGGSDYYVALKSPDSLTQNTTYVLPPTPIAGQFLTTNASGQTSWGAFINSSKIIQYPDAYINAGVAISTVAGSNVSTVDISALSAENASDQLDVYINGQMLVSSSVDYANISNLSDGDYSISNVSSSTDFKFTFDVEQGDILTVVARAY